MDCQKKKLIRLIGIMRQISVYKIIMNDGIEYIVKPIGDICGIYNGMRYDSDSAMKYIIVHIIGDGQINQVVIDSNCIDRITREDIREYEEI